MLLLAVNANDAAFAVALHLVIAHRRQRQRTELPTERDAAVDHRLEILDVAAGIRIFHYSDGRHFAQRQIRRAVGFPAAFLDHGEGAADLDEHGRRLLYGEIRYSLLCGGLSNPRDAMSDIRRVLVVGGGVGGLTAAASFAQRGVEVLLIERRPAFDVPGVGLGQPANALRIYDALGLLPEILASGFAYDRMYIFDPNRELIVAHKFLMGDAKVPAFCALSRLRLHEILLAGAERAGAKIRTGVTFGDIRDEGDRVAMTFSDGGTGVFDLVAGFDGIRSATRQYLFGT